MNYIQISQKKHLVYFLNLAVIINIITFFILVIFDLNIKVNLSIIFFATLLSIFFTINAKKAYKREKKKLNNVQEAMEAIVYFFTSRLMLWFGLVGYLLLVWLSVWTYNILDAKGKEDSVLLFAYLKFLMVQGVIDIFLFYFDCTFSLPPEEKKKREEAKEEKRLRNAIPNT